MSKAKEGNSGPLKIHRSGNSWNLKAVDSNNKSYYIKTSKNKGLLERFREMAYEKGGLIDPFTKDMKKAAEDIKRMIYINAPEECNYTNKVVEEFQPVISEINVPDFWEVSFGTPERKLPVSGEFLYSRMGEKDYYFIVAEEDNLIDLKTGDIINMREILDNSETYEILTEVSLKFRRK